MRVDIDINLNDYVKKLLNFSRDAIINAKNVDLILGQIKGIIEEDGNTYFFVQTCRDNHVLIEAECFGETLKVSKSESTLTITPKKSETSTIVPMIADVLFVIGGANHFNEGSLKGYRYFELKSFQVVRGVQTPSLKNKSDL